MRATTIRECSSCGATNVHNKEHCLICKAPLSVLESNSDDFIDSSIEENASSDTPETRLCPECRQMIDSDASYCMECGAAIAEQKPAQPDKICPACKEPVESDSAYCSQCGQLLR